MLSVQNIAVMHLIFLSLWGGVVATEIIIETLAYRKTEFSSAAFNFHFWIDLLIEAPLIILVVVTGVALLTLIDRVTFLHIVKVLFASIVVISSILCIYFVIIRKLRYEANKLDEGLLRLSRLIHIVGLMGLCCALVVVPIGLWLAYQRMFAN